MGGMRVWGVWGGGREGVEVSLGEICSSMTTRGGEMSVCVWGGGGECGEGR